MAARNAFYAQWGGVTAVINASAAGVIETARAHKDKIGKVYAGRNGIIGALTEDLIDTSKESPRAIAGLMKHRTHCFDPRTRVVADVHAFADQRMAEFG